MTDGVGQAPLAGLRVVEFAHMVMGPACGLMLAELRGGRGVQGRERVGPVVAAALGRFDRAGLMARCEALGLPFTPIAKPVDLFDDPHWNASGGLVPLTLADGRAVRLPALPLSLDGERLA